MKLASTVLAVAAALTLAACGSDDDSSTTTGAAGSPTTTAAAGAPGPFPVSIVHSFGTTEIESAPQRVATVGFNEQDFALALGVEPVAIREFIGDFDYKTRPWAPGAEDPAPAVVGAEEIDFEKLAAARPDVILGIYSFVDRAGFRKLAQIAPTVAQTKDFDAGAVPWDRQLLDTGKALGREARAKQVVADVDARFEAAERENPEFEGRTLTVAFEGGGSLFNLADSDLRQQFFTDLGFETPRGAGIDAISTERLEVLDQDVLVLITDDMDGLLKNPLFRRLEAAREGRVIPVSSSSPFAGALGYNSPLSRPYLLEQALPRLKAAVDGDPATEVEAAQ